MHALGTSGEGPAVERAQADPVHPVGEMREAGYHILIPSLFIFREAWLLVVPPGASAAETLQTSWELQHLGPIPSCVIIFCLLNSL